MPTSLENLTTLQNLRQAAEESFAHSGYPHAKMEEWRFTSVASIAKTNFQAALPPPREQSDPLFRHFTMAGDAAAELVFINGHFSPERSTICRLSGSTHVLPLAEALAKHPKFLAQHLGHYADIHQNPFVALNTAQFSQGAVVHITRRAQVDLPIHLLFLTVPDESPIAVHPRNFIIAEENSSATVVETYAGPPSSPFPQASSPKPPASYFTNAVTEILLRPNASLDHYKLQQESLNASHVATTQAELGASAKFVSQSASLGAALSRNDLNVVLNGRHAEATLNGLVLLTGDQHADNHTLLRHEQPNCASHELYKHVLAGSSSGVFKGKIFVQHDAQKTDAKQTSKSLLLSNEAAMNSQPALEIYADDVKCTHGSTIGPVDDEMVFYLRSRGISHEAARHLLTYAFAADITRRIRVEPVRRRLEDFMAAQQGLPQDLRITDLGRHDEKSR